MYNLSPFSMHQCYECQLFLTITSFSNIVERQMRRCWPLLCSQWENFTALDLFSRYSSKYGQTRTSHKDHWAFEL